MSHTPGPWEFDSSTGRVDAVAFRKPSGHFIEQPDGSKREYIGGLVALPYTCGEANVRDGNARLIAAAPEMYRVLQQIERLSREADDKLVDVRAMLGDLARDAIAEVGEPA